MNQKGSSGFTKLADHYTAAALDDVLMAMPGLGG